MVVPLEARLGDPARWLLDNRDLLPPGGTVLDVACGTGRNALWLVRQGFRVRAIDRDPVAIRQLHDAGVAAEVIDLETDPPPSLGSDLDAVVVFNYLHRPLFPLLRAAVRPGGLIFYETFTTRQADRGHPRSPAFLLKDGELAGLLAPFTVLRAREGDFEGRFVASSVAQRRD